MTTSNGEIKIVVVMKVWTESYQPFRLGPVHIPISCELEVEGPFDLGKGYEGVLVTAPNGKQFVAERGTGAFVGSSLDTVRGDIDQGDEKVMKDQVARALDRSKHCETVTPEEFWRLLRCSG